MKTAFTIATANYLAQAKSVADSFCKYHSDFSFVIILLDKVNGRFDVSYFQPTEIIEVEALGIEDLDEMALQYTIFELSNALKPFVAEWLLRSSAVDTLIYLDSDLLIYNSFAEALDLLKTYNIILTPHLLSPLPLDGKELSEPAFLNSGIYNAGFFALSKSDETFSFLLWWKQRLRRYCFIDFTKGFFVDQIWLNLVPCYYPGSYILKHPGYNAAYWNLHERTLSLLDGDCLINSSYPLVFFHFSGYKYNLSGSLSTYQTRYSFEEREDVLPLFKGYKEVVFSNNHETFSLLPCYYVELKKEVEEKRRIAAEEEERRSTSSMRRLGRALKLKLRHRVDMLLS